MHSHAPLERWRQARTALPGHHHAAERKARLVFALTVATMGVELVAGWWTGSMALTADGWHMGSHAAALGIAAFAYAFARRHFSSERFSFGTGKVSALAGFASALLLAMVAVLMAAESLGRLVDPVEVHFDEAILVAVIGLAVNVASAVLLSAPGAGHAHSHDRGHHEGHDHGHRDHPHGHHDHNLRAAYLHVVADALTSVLAIGALIAGGWLGLVWLDPLVGIFAAGLIAWWALGLLRTSSRVLLDAEDHADLRERITRLIESDADNRVADVRVWSLGGRAKAAIIAIVTHRPRSANYYKNLIASVPELHHVTTEVHLCDVDPCDVHLPPGKA